VCVHAEQERNEEMVGVPEGFEGLLSDPVVSGRIHQKHEQKHHVSSNSTCFGVVDLECYLGSHLRSFNVEEAVIWLAWDGRVLLLNILDVMRCDVKDGEKQHSVSDLSVEPLGLVEWEPSRLGSEPTEDVSAHRHDDDHSVDTQNQTGTSRDPY
jgi:hypothetical protein